MVHNRARSRRGLPASSWLPPPQGSGMRSLFLGTQGGGVGGGGGGGGGGKRECAGTGVFLPRRTGIQSEPRKKPGP